MRRIVLEHLYDRVVEGLPVLGTPLRVAERELDRSVGVAEAVDRVSNRYTIACAGTGFAFGVPGYAAMPATVPANVAAVAALQLHLAATVAALAGHDVRDPTVRTRCVDCVDGADHEEGASTLDSLGGRVTGKLGERALRFLVEGVLGRLARGSRATRSMPLLGGGIGALADGRSTLSVTERARREFLTGAGGGSA